MSQAADKGPQSPRPGGLLGRTYLLVRPYGLGRLAAVLSLSLAQALLQVVGVTSVLPFLSVAADPDKFRGSELGQALLAWLPEMDNTTLLLVFGSASLLVLAASSILSVVAQYARSRYAQGFAHWLRTRMLLQLADQPYAYFLQHNSAILNKKINQDVQAFSSQVLSALLDIATGLVVTLFLVLAILMVDLYISLGAIVILGGYYALVFNTLARRRRRVNEGLKDAARETHYRALGFISGIKAIRMFGAEKHYIDNYVEHSRRMARLNARMPIYIVAPKHLIEPLLFGALIGYLMLSTGRGENFSDVLPVLSVIALAGYRMIPAMQLLYARFTQLSAMRHTLDEVFDELLDIERGEPLRIWSGPDRETLDFKSLSLQQLAFTYPGAQQPTLQGIDLTIRRGDTLAITGASGSGKSTLLDILLGLQLPSAGKCLLNGRDMAHYPAGQYQSCIGYVQQDSFLTDESIRANVAFGLAPEEVDMTRLREACRRAQILDTIEQEMEQGFDTQVGDRGVKLSGGQRQRIALARALYREPQILILDEATSALDYQTESLVNEAIDSLRGDITLIIVTHRTDAISDIHRRYELLGGQLVPAA